MPKITVFDVMMFLAFEACLLFLPIAYAVTIMWFYFGYKLGREVGERHLPLRTKKDRFTILASLQYARHRLTKHDKSGIHGVIGLKRLNRLIKELS